MDEWKETLFVWRGFVEAGNEEGEIVFEGTWVGQEKKADFPTNEEFENSENKFKLVGRNEKMSKKGPIDEFFGAKSKSDKKESKEMKIEVKKDEDGAPKDDEKMVIRFDNIRSSYLLDNGDGLKSYKDVEHVLYMDDFSSKHPNYAVACAYGRTEFGEFVSKGYVDKETAPGKTLLTLARRYIEDKDPRFAEMQESILTVVSDMMLYVELNFDLYREGIDDQLELLNQVEAGTQKVPNKTWLTNRDIMLKRKADYEKIKFENETCGRVPFRVSSKRRKLK